MSLENGSEDLKSTLEKLRLDQIGMHKLMLLRIDVHVLTVQ